MQVLFTFLKIPKIYDALCKNKNRRQSLPKKNAPQITNTGTGRYAEHEQTRTGCPHSGLIKNSNKRVMRREKRIALRSFLKRGK